MGRWTVMMWDLAKNIRVKDSCKDLLWLGSIEFYYKDMKKYLN